ncbi:hypothetical protein BDEG_27302 [Batrachochytrium dendrobatidis JEL423]|uniref:Sensitive to high expression protein 9, mitochondrial n=1 Tax=Batrachochytrium dendrobatidis (strain JEL423) TaxID=403673 RepID=A0A177WXA1_BATDL|nr:hypothetical protein BDEG_27302 [Batrachochytrium dendrobatidis JEL423]
MQTTLSHYQTSLTTQSHLLAALLNRFTGYDKVELRKSRVDEKDKALIRFKADAGQAKLQYEETIDERRRTQKELNSLLQRKDSWLDMDITRFTELYRKDLSLEQSETAAQGSYKLATEQFEKAQVEYLSEIRERYVEEQLYSDKIRQASTWWTWGLISTHFVIFIAIQFYVEPKKKEALKRDMTAIILETSKHDRLGLTLELKDIMISQQKHIEQLHHDLDFSALTSPSTVDDTVKTPKPIATNVSNTLLSTASFWQGTCAGAVVSFLGFALFFGGR